MCVFSLSEHFLKLDSVLQVNEGRQICRCLVALPTWGKFRRKALRNTLGGPCGRAMTVHKGARMSKTNSQ